MPANPESQSAICGLVYRVGDDFSADEILAPEYLSFDLDDPEERRWLGAYAMAHLTGQPTGFVPVGEFRSPYSIVVAGRQFGCGSARLHSPVALAEAGVRCVVADSFAPGFMRAAVNAGLLHCITFATPGEGADIDSGTQVEVDLDQLILGVGDRRLALAPIGITRKIVEAGGLAAYLKADEPPIE